MIMHTRDRRLKTTGCPDWCAGGHRCTARLGGEHVSPPEVWDTGTGRVVATRYLHSRSVHTSGGHVEIRLVVPLPVGEEEAVEMMRALIAGTHHAASRIVDQATV